MMAKKYDWDAIAESPKFQELTRRKRTFLFGWWGFASVLYFLLIAGAGYAPELFKIKIIGNINFCYLFALFQFLTSWGIAMYYAHVANKEFDRLTHELIDELQ
ncbi:MAG: DUF485 domain-containing protein [Desulfuromonadaceae bacterium]|nr:DUF485 domain-containing protein [Desulfuromonadaceae bacterium]